MFSINSVKRWRLFVSVFRRSSLISEFKRGRANEKGKQLDQSKYDIKWRNKIEWKGKSKSGDCVNEYDTVSEETSDYIVLKNDDNSKTSTVKRNVPITTFKLYNTKTEKYVLPKIENNVTDSSLFPPEYIEALKHNPNDFECAAPDTKHLRDIGDEPENKNSPSRKYNEENETNDQPLGNVKYSDYIVHNYQCDSIENKSDEKATDNCFFQFEKQSNENHPSGLDENCSNSVAVDPYLHEISNAEDFSDSHDEAEKGKSNILKPDFYQCDSVENKSDEKATADCFLQSEKQIIDNENLKHPSGLDDKCSNSVAADSNLDELSAALDISDSDDETEKYEPNILEPGLKDVSHIAPLLRPTFNLASYSDKAPIIQKLMALGVKLYKINKKKTIAEFIVKLDYDENVMPYIRFLESVGIPRECLGNFFTKNPSILMDDIDDLKVRINYLESKNFSKEMITNIVNTNPMWLSREIEYVDKMLGYLQKKFKLSGEEVRIVVNKCPPIINVTETHLEKVTFTLTEEMGFSNKQNKYMLLKQPKLWLLEPPQLRQRFDLVHNEMQVPHSLIANDCRILFSRAFRIRDRNAFLKALGKAQYDPTKPLYVSTTELVSGSDAQFCINVAKTSVDTYNQFLKSI